MSPVLTRDSVENEAISILKSLQENARAGRSNKLADVKVQLERTVSLDFDSYFFFLRKFHYIAMDREAQLRLTDVGEGLLGGGALGKFSNEVQEFFADEIIPTDSGIRITTAEEPSEPALLESAGNTGEFFMEEKNVAPIPPPPQRRRPPPVPAEDSPSEPLPPPAPAIPPPTPYVPSPPPVAAATAGSKGTDIDTRYVKFDPVGTGPLGTVFKGKQNSLGTDVAIKELKDIFGYFSFLQRGEVIKRLKKEVCQQAQVRHPGVVQVLDQNVDVARPYFVMELCNGSLREKLDAAQGKGLPKDLAVRTFLQMVYALRTAHQAGLFHHNLKPENVLLDAYGNVKLSDFGMTRVVEVDASKGMPQVFVGTGGMPYMAPEMMARSKEAQASADVYSLGILLFEMLTGQVPGRRTPLPSELNSDVPAKLDPLFDKMTQDKREARYPDMESVLDEFFGAFSDGEYLSKGDLVLWAK